MLFAPESEELLKELQVGLVPFCADPAARDSVAHVIVTLDPVTLHDLARCLATPRERQGVGCTSAINLSGDTSSGALYAPGAGKVPVVSGPAGFAQASFVLVTPRSALGWQGR